MKSVLTIFVLLALGLATSAQSDAPQAIPPKSQYLDLSGGFGSNITAVPLAYFYDWNLGKKHRFVIGTGLRFNSVWGSGLDFSSAPASIAGEAATEDTLTLSNPAVYAANVVVNLGYHFTPRLMAGFNIDAIGVSFGPERSGVFASNGTTRIVSAKPTSFNWLLVGNNDKGTLNSEFYIRYRVGERLGVKAAYQYLFTEYTTNTEVQTVPENNDRFRNKSSLFNIGISWQL